MPPGHGGLARAAADTLETVRRPLSPSSEAGKGVLLRMSADLSTARTVLDAADVNRAITRMAHEVVERNKGASDLVVLGIPSRGVPLAHRLAAKISEVERIDVPVGALDVTMYRDDLRLRPARALERTEIPAVGVDGAVVVLVDDVLFSGRTIRAALTALEDIGRPQAVRLVVLVDRGHRQLPIRADHVGKNIPTSTREVVRVQVEEIDGQDAVLLGTSVDSADTGSAQHRDAR